MRPLGDEEADEGVKGIAVTCHALWKLFALLKGQEVGGVREARMRHPEQWCGTEAGGDRRWSQ